MRKVATLAVAVVLSACQNEKPAETTAAAVKPAAPAQQAASQPAMAASQPAMAQQAASQPAMAAAGGGLKGKILEKIDAAGYSYLRLQTAEGEAWAAVTETPTPVGATVEIVNASPMHNFESKTLNRKWETILFGALGAGAAEGAAPTNPNANPNANPGKVDLPGGHPPMTAPADVGDVKVEKAKAANGKTIAEVFANRAKLKDAKVTIHGKVVKSSNGIMDKNWLHLRDGSGSDATKDNDLTVTTQGTANVGDVVTIEGVVRLDKDFGAGYAYTVIVEEAVVQK